MLCVPLSKQATVVGLLYLENNALTSAFTNELVEVVQVLAAQAVISLENSTLLGELQEFTGALENASLSGRGNSPMRLPRATRPRRHSVN